MTIYFETIGKGEDIVLLHGWGFHSGVWQEFAEKLAQHYRVTLLDLPGFGRSALPTEKYDLTMVLKYVLQASPPRAHFLGWSLGGLIAMAIAQQQPQRINKLITIASTPQFVAAEHWPGVALSTLEKFAQDLICDYEKTIPQFLLLQTRSNDKQFKNFKNLKSVLLQYGVPSNTALLGGLNILHDMDLRSELPALICQQQHIFGRLDTLVPVSIKQKIEALVPTAQTVLMDHAGHMPFLSHREETFDLVQKFLNA